MQTQGLVHPSPNTRVPTLSCLEGHLAPVDGAGGPVHPHWCPSPGSCSFPTRCSASTAKSLLFRFLPFLHWLPRYPVKDWLLGDIASGFSVGIMHLPQGE